MTPLHLKIPATSANLGPGFDALGLAMALYLDIHASESPDTRIEATGRNADLVGSLEHNLILDTYRDLAPTGPPLHLRIENQIPLGMGCGSSAAALLAGVLLANHFSNLHLTPQEVCAEACRREGHPDNVAAAFYGGLTVSAIQQGIVTTATIAPPPWHLILALPPASLATEKARALLPPTYSRADTVQNIQATALLVSAFALNRPDLLAAATRDRIHQPYRSVSCPLLPLLAPLTGRYGVFSVTLSGAGPSVLLIVDPSKPAESIEAAIRSVGLDSRVEILHTTMTRNIVATASNPSPVTIES